MAFTFGFYNSLSGDRRYNSEQMSDIFDGLVTDGVYRTIGDIFATVPGNGMQVIVKSGRGWFNRTWNYNDAALPLQIDAADVTRARIDAVVLEVNREQASRTNRIFIKKGVPLTTPVKPTMENSEFIKQYPLAYVRVPASASSITGTNIEIAVGTSECPFVTGLLESVSIEDLFQEWDDDFQTWFDNIKAQLEDNVVTNLQRQIDERLKIVDKATNAEATAGTNDTKYMTPAKTTLLTKKYDDALNIVDGVYNSSSAGSYEFIPRGYTQEIRDLLPCTGGIYSSEEFPDLFENIGMTYGGSLGTTIPETLISTYIRSGTIDPITGIMYISNSTNQIHIFSSIGSLLRVINLPIINQSYPNLEGAKYIKAYNHCVIACCTCSSPTGNTSYHFLMASNDDGLTWTNSSTSFNSIINQDAMATDISIFEKPGTSDLYGVVSGRAFSNTCFDFRNKQFVNIASIITNWESYNTPSAASVISGMSAKGPIFYATSNGVLYRLSGNSLVTTGILNMSTSTYYEMCPGFFIDDDFYVSSSTTAYIFRNGVSIKTTTSLPFSGSSFGFSKAVKYRDTIIFTIKRFGTGSGTYSLFYGDPFESTRDVSLTNGVLKTDIVDFISYNNDIYSIGSAANLYTATRFNITDELFFTIPTLTYSSTAGTGFRNNTDIIPYIRSKSHIVK